MSGIGAFGYNGYGGFSAYRGLWSARTAGIATPGGAGPGGVAAVATSSAPAAGTETVSAAATGVSGGAGAGGTLSVNAMAGGAPAWEIRLPSLQSPPHAEETLVRMRIQYPAGESNPLPSLSLPSASPALSSALSNAADSLQAALQGRIAGLENEEARKEADLAEAKRIAATGEEEAEIPGVGENKSAAEVAEDTECKTCAERKYQDGSDDPGVSFKTATTLSPEQAATAVRGHEQEHVVREQAKAAREGRKVVSQSVTIHTAICPECGRVYISGGTTRTVTSAKFDSEAEADGTGSVKGRQETSAFFTA